ncbi:MAG TPA: (deoxy)nucleoside triphosphate pyrophosphohydrolase [Sphingomonas sp.]|jgi:8-oxo-dGTP diphosphatase|nr:(deoxy)nucleoside triphosphate pyrophosphohydrolase [Sphingomonas sp.]
MANDGAAAGLLLVVAAALTDPEGRVLLQQRPPGKHLAGLWEFPGGKIEPGETPEAALVRELREELGIAVNAAALTPVTFASAAAGSRHLILMLYRVETWAGTPQPLDATALRWDHPAAMHALPMPPADVPLVEALCASERGR